VTAACDRFEREALLLLEEGRVLPPHFATCPDCQKARGTYERLVKALSPPGLAPNREEFEAGVWAKIAAGEGRGSATPRARHWGRIAAAAVVVLGSAALLTWRGLAKRTPEMLAMRLEAAPRPGAERRGLPTPADEGAVYLQPGDELVFDASTGGAAHAEVRVYREDRQLALRCPPGCAREGDRLKGRVTLPAPGRYQAYVVASDKALPEPAPTLAEDTEGLLREGARVSLGQPVRVY
jgi:hypothetical protein